MKRIKQFIQTFREDYAKAIMEDGKNPEPIEAQSEVMEFIECGGEAPPVAIYHKLREKIMEDEAVAEAARRSL